MKIAVGSSNPVKLKAVQQMAKRVWPDAEVCAVAVPSGVDEMPREDRQTIAGARNRAHAARQQTSADLGVGLEGGVHPHEVGLLLQGWVVIVDRDGREGLGAAAQIPLPPVIADRVLNGEELGPVMDDLLDEEDVKKRGGAVGALTAGLVPRENAFAVAVAYALAPFISPQFYNSLPD